MGAVIPVDFGQRRQKHASLGLGVAPDMHGDTAAVAPRVACLACLRRNTLKQ